MSRWSPTVLPTGVSVLGSAIRGGAEGWEAGREERRRKRRDELADVLAEAGLRDQGISRDPRTQAGRLARMGEEAVRALPNVNLSFDPGMGIQPAPQATMGDDLQGMLRRNAPRPGDEELAAQGRARLPSSETTFAPRPLAPVPTMSTTLTPSTRPQLESLGHGYSRDPERTPEARAESRRRAMRDELTGTLARAGFTPGEAELGGTVPETIGPTMTRQSAEARRQRIAGFVNAIPTQPGHAGHTALLAEVDPSGLRGELHPAEPRDYETPAERRSRELELENVRFGHDKVIAGIRARPDTGRPLTLPQAVAIIYDYNVDERNKPRWAPAEAHRLAQRLVAGTLRPEDLAPAPTPAAAPAEPGHFWRDVGRVGGAILRGSGATGPAPVTSGAPTPPAPRQPPQGRKTPVSQQDYDDAVADQGAAYAARHYIVVSR